MTKLHTISREGKRRARLNLIIFHLTAHACHQYYNISMQTKDMKTYIHMHINVNFWNISFKQNESDFTLTQLDLMYCMTTLSVIQHANE